MPDGSGTGRPAAASSQSDGASTCKEGQVASRPRGRGCRRLVILALLLLVLVITVALLPTLVSTGWGTGIVLRFANEMIPGRVEIDGLALSWGEGQSIRQFRLLDPEGMVVLEVDGMAAPNLSIAAMLQGSTDLGTVPIGRVAMQPDRLPAALAETLPEGSEEEGPTAGLAARPVGGTGAGSVVIPWRFRLEVDQVDVTYGLGDEEPVLVAASELVVDRLQSTDLAVTVSAEVVQGSLSGRLDIDLELGALFDLEMRLQPGRLVPRKVNVAAEVLPTVLLDRLLGMEGVVSELLGPVLNAKLEASGAEIASFQGEIELRSKALTLKGRLRNAEEISFASSEPAMLWITPEFYESVAHYFEALAGTRLTQPVATTVAVTSLAVPVIDGSLDFAQARCEVAVTFDDVTVHTDAAGLIGLREMQVRLHAGTLGRQIVLDADAVAWHDTHAGRMTARGVINDLYDAQGRVNRGGFQADLRVGVSAVPTRMFAQFVPWPDGVLEAGIGNLLDAELKANYDASVAVTPVALTVRADRLNATFHGGATPAGGLMLTGGVDVEWTPRLAQLLVDHYAVHLPEPARGLQLQEAVNTALSVKQLQVEKNFDFGSATVAATLAVDRVTPGGMAALNGVVVRDLAVEMSRSSEADRLDMAMSMQFDHGEGRGRLALAGTVTEPFGNRGVTVEGHLTGVSVSDLERRFAEVGAWVPWLGPTLDRMTWKVASDPQEGHWTWQAEAVTATLVASHFSGRYRAETGTVEAAPAKLVYRMKPSTAGALFGGGADAPFGLALRESVDVTCDLQRFTVTLGPGPDRWRTIDAAAASLDLRVAVASVPLIATTTTGQRIMSLQNMALSVAGVGGAFDITLGGNLTAVDPATGRSATTSLQSRTAIRNFFEVPEGGDLAVTTDTQFPDTPVALLDGMAGANGKLNALLGPVASVQVVGDFPGALTVTVHSDNADADIALDTTRRGDHYAIALTRDLQARLMPAEETFRVLFGEVHPIFSDAVAAKDPILLTVKRDPFHVPIPFDEPALRRLELEVLLQIGTLEMRRRGWVTEAIGGLADEASRMAKAMRHDDDGDAKVDTYEAKFSPLQVQVRNGVIKTSELWIVSADLAMGFQGGADMASHRYRFFMGLAGASLLVEEPGLIEIVDPGNIYDVPVSGTIGQDPVIDKRELMAALAGSALKQQASAHAGELGLLGDTLREGLDQLILKPQQAERRRKLGLRWHVPEEVRLFVARTEQALAKRPPDAPAKEAKEEPKRGNRRNDSVEDQLKKEAGRLLEGLFNR